MIRLTKVALAVAVVTAVLGISVALVVLSNVGEPTQADRVATCLRVPSGAVTDARTELELSMSALIVANNQGRDDVAVVTQLTSAQAGLTNANELYQDALRRSLDDPGAYLATCTNGG